MVNTCSSKCYYWQIDAGVFRREGNKHKHTGLVGGETGPVFLEIIWLYQSKAVKPFISFLLTKRNSETRANIKEKLLRVRVCSKNLGSINKGSKDPCPCGTHTVTEQNMIVIDCTVIKTDYGTVFDA